MLTSSQNIELFMQYTQSLCTRHYKGVEVENDFFLTMNLAKSSVSTKRWAHSLGYAPLKPQMEIGLKINTNI
jgi:hypothetical protein